MKNQSRLKRTALDILIIAMAVLPFILCIVLKVLTDVPSDDIDITGAKIYFTIPMPIQDLPITEAQVTSAAVVISLFWICIFLTRNLKVRPESKRQLVAEWVVEKVDSLVKENMGERFAGFAPFIAAVMGLSALSSFSSLLGLFPPTSDMNIVAGWAILVFILITYYKMKCGPLVYIKSFAEPVAFLAPMNVISEFATPVSMAFRHYGNILSGSVISVLVASGLKGLSAKIFGALPGVFGTIPYLRVGLPAVLSIYFDIFSGALQAFIFAMLTMLYVSSGFPADEYEKRLQKKREKAAAKAEKQVKA